MSFWFSAMHPQGTGQKPVEEKLRHGIALTLRLRVIWGQDGQPIRQIINSGQMKPIHRRWHLLLSLWCSMPNSNALLTALSWSRRKEQVAPLPRSPSTYSRTTSISSWIKSRIETQLLNTLSTVHVYGSHARELLLCNTELLPKKSLGSEQHIRKAWTIPIWILSSLAHRWANRSSTLSLLPSWEVSHRGLLYHMS